MAFKPAWAFVSALSIMGMTLSAAPALAGPEHADPAANEILNLGLRGAYFVPNQGQWSDTEVCYGMRSRGLDVALRESAFTMHLSRGLDDDASAASDHLALAVTFPGSNAVPPVGGKPQAAKFNYFVGGEGRGAASNVPSFGSVVYDNLYDGIDLVVAGSSDGIFKYEFHVAPGADYSQIRIAYDGIESLCIGDTGDLQINTSFGTLADGAPVVWQENGGTADPAVETREAEAPPTEGRVAPCTKAAIPARFELCDDRTYRIVVDGPVDPTRSLIIDPDVEWMTHLGGARDDYGWSIAVDSAGNALVTGYTLSTDFAGRNNTYHGGDRDAFVVKVNASGAVQWMTYFGGSDYDWGQGIAVDHDDNAVVTGWTNSTDFSGRNNAYHGGARDAFVVKVSASGTLQWMTYTGGSGDDYGYGIAVDSASNLLVAGTTFSTDFMGRNNAYHGGFFDSFAVKVSASGVLHWMTYLGGRDWEESRDLAVDGADSALVTGYTHSTDFEGRNNAYHGDRDAFVVKVSASGAPQWMTYLGGSGLENGVAIALDSDGDALATGTTNSSDFAGQNNARYDGPYDAFVVKVGASGALQWMTYLGGSGSEGGFAMAVDSAGNSLATGFTTSADFEGRNRASYGNHDAFVVKVSPSGALQWMTYLGGSGFDDGYGIAVVDDNIALVTGGTSSTDFEGRNNSSHGDYDAFVVKLRIAERPQLSVDATCPYGGPVRIEWSRATPGGEIALIFARNTGSFIIPNGTLCAGTQLGLASNQIQLAWQGAAGPNGSRIVDANAGPGACGGYLQLLDISTCGTSNVARLE